MGLGSVGCVGCQVWVFPCSFLSWGYMLQAAWLWLNACSCCQPSRSRPCKASAEASRPSFAITSKPFFVGFPSFLRSIWFSICEYPDYCRASFILNWAPLFSLLLVMHCAPKNTIFSRYFSLSQKNTSGLFFSRQEHCFSAPLARGDGMEPEGGPEASGLLVPCSSSGRLPQGGGGLSFFAWLMCGYLPVSVMVIVDAIFFWTEEDAFLRLFLTCTYLPYRCVV